jgi:uroporphyrinogen decarboxylase
MTSRERLLTVLSGGLPDCVPVAPDFSNMIPARLTSKPFWDLYLYRDPPIWEAYVACARHFDIDSLMDGYFPLTLDPPSEEEAQWETFIIQRAPERILTQRSRRAGRKRVWAPGVNVYYRADSPTHNVPIEKLGLPPVPKRYEPLEGVKPVDLGPEGLKRLKAMMGDQGLVGVRGGAGTLGLSKVEGVYDYYDNPAKYERLAEERTAQAERWVRRVLALEVKPDFLCVGGSGTLVFQTVEIMRKIALPSVKRVIEIASRAGMPTHVHSCGPERELVRIMAEETELTVIDPLEPPPMGDCDLAELKRLYGRKLTLKGNLQTTDVLLRGSAADVVRASRKAIDDAAEGGRFILSTGDQCGRDTPDENLRAMIDTARGYGRYR